MTEAEMQARIADLEMEQRTTRRWWRTGPGRTPTESKQIDKDVKKRERQISTEIEVLNRRLVWGNADWDKTRQFDRNRRLKTASE